MPMYPFECEACGKRFDELTAYDRRGDVACPDCGGATRVLVAGFAMKAGGGASGPAPVRSSGFS
jgi:putative FmdB family regulatory protein